MLLFHQPLILLLTASSLVSSIALDPEIAKRGPDECTNDQTNWSNYCQTGASDCCFNGNWFQCDLVYFGLSDYWEAYCDDPVNFSGQNCAHAYNQGARYEESAAGGFDCGIK